MEILSPLKHQNELAYAEYANSMKALANQARLESIRTKEMDYDKQAKKVYQAEVDSLMVKLNDAQMNSVRERAAQRTANIAKQKAINEAKAAGGKLKKADASKIGQRALSGAREDLGAVARRDRNIKITDREWEAIQAGAISKTQLRKILNNADVDELRERATPRASTEFSNAKVAQIQAMSGSYTIAQLAKKFDCSPSTISKYLKKGAN